MNGIFYLALEESWTSQQIINGFFQARIQIVIFLALSARPKLASDLITFLYSCISLENLILNNFS